jgi:lipopolysaccharide/colanic/teichoic acid biosynthesis glycosyltransferase
LTVLFGILITIVIIVAEHFYSAAFATYEERSQQQEVRDVIDKLIASTSVPSATVVKPTDFPLHQRIIKRFVDILAGSIGLIFVAPMLVLLAVLVRLDSEGPAVVRVARLGYRGKRIYLWRFRTTLADGTKTRVGRWLSRSSLDVIPELVNVVLGELTLVGPLPGRLPASEYAEVNTPLMSLQPGLTGPWVSLAHANPTVEDYVSLQWKYLQDWSPGRDVLILLRTALMTLFGREWNPPK